MESGTSTAWVPQSKPIRFTELGCPAIDRGTNQPNVFFDPKSSESFTPYFSGGWRDDTIQRPYPEAIYPFWGEAANNPLSSVYGGRMVDVPECAAWTWDARPYPVLPRTDRCLNGRAELALRALADGAPRCGLARRARPASLEAWVERESAVFRLPPARLAFDSTLW